MSKSPEVKKLTAHVFVCTNERAADAPRGCCKAKDSEALLQALKQAAAERGLAGKIRVQKSGCLDVCESGAAVVVYPEGVWYGNVTVADANAIVDSHLVGGVPVERLRIIGK